MFRLLGRAIRGSDASTIQEITSTLSKIDLPEAATGMEFMQKVTYWLYQEQFKKLPVDYAFETPYYSEMPEFKWHEKGGMPVLRVNTHYMGRTDRKTSPYFGVNLVLAENMGWVTPTDTIGVYNVGPNLILITRNDKAQDAKKDPDNDKSSLLTFTRPLHAHQGMVYLSCAYQWDFVNLDEACEKATTHVYHPPQILNNTFKWIMDTPLAWSIDSGLSTTDTGFIKLEMSPHYWNKKVMVLSLTKSGNRYRGTFSWGISRLLLNQTYRLVIEVYMTDKMVFDKMSISAAATLYIQLLEETETKHAHEYNGTHMLYYHCHTRDFWRLGG